MTDNKIIKALECCRTPKCSNCAECPKRGLGTDCLGELIADTLDLINRQKAEIEKLQADCDAAWTEYDGMQISYDLLFDEASALIKKTKAEAIKEFAERLKTTIHNSIYEYWNFGTGGYYLAEGVYDDIDDLAEEMTGE